MGGNAVGELAGCKCARGIIPKVQTKGLFLTQSRQDSKYAKWYKKNDFVELLCDLAPVRLSLKSSREWYYTHYTAIQAF
jgi:hypothetical protein